MPSGIKVIGILVPRCIGCNIMSDINLRLPWDLLRNAFTGIKGFGAQLDADECAKYAAMQMKKRYDGKHKDIFFNVGDMVYLKIMERIRGEYSHVG
jgi:hypothetical protein